MKRSTTIALISLSAIILAGGIALNALYRPPAGAATVTAPRAAGNRHGAGTADIRSARRGAKGPSVEDPHAIASIFGWSAARKRAVKTAPAKPAPAKPVVDATWIRFVGSITGSDGVAYEYFMNEKTGTMIKTAKGRSIDGWLLEKAGHDADILRHGKEELRVRMSNQ